MNGDDGSDVPMGNLVNYAFEDHRLYSLLVKPWPNQNVTVYALAKCGFFYTGDEDNCRCFFCKLEVRGWEQGDTADGEHRRWNPRCPFLNQSNLLENVPIGRMDVNQTHNNHLYERKEQFHPVTNNPRRFFQMVIT